MRFFAGSEKYFLLKICEKIRIFAPNTHKNVM